MINNLFHFILKLYQFICIKVQRIAILEFTLGTYYTVLYYNKQFSFQTKLFSRFIIVFVRK